MEPCVLLYALPPEEAATVSAVCAAEGFSVHTVPPAQYGLTLEQAAGLVPAPSVPPPPRSAPLVPMLLFVWLSPDDRDRLLDAQKHPENYRNLIVRVWGWSVYFVELNEVYQNHIIKRTEMIL